MCPVVGPCSAAAAAAAACPLLDSAVLFPTRANTDVCRICEQAHLQHYAELIFTVWSSCWKEAYALTET